MPRLHLWGSKRSFPVEGISQFSDPGSGSTGMYLACSNFHAKFQQFLVCGNWIVEACWIQGQHEHHCRVLAPLCCCNEGTYRCLWHHMAQYGPIWPNMAQYGSVWHVMSCDVFLLCLSLLRVPGCCGCINFPKTSLPGWAGQKETWRGLPEHWSISISSSVFFANLLFQWSEELAKLKRNQEETGTKVHGTS